MNTGLLLPAFRFEVTLVRSATVIAGAQQPPGSTATVPAPSERQEIGNGGFQECSGLDIEMDIQDYNEGGRNDGVIRRAGRAKLQPLVLKRGMFFAPSPNGGTDGDNKVDASLWRWLQSIVNGARPIVRYDGSIHVKSADNTVRATWVFERGLPAKIRGPELNGKTGEIAIEELHIAHEGIHLLLPDEGAPQ